MQLVIVLGLLRKNCTVQTNAFLGRDQLVIKDQSKPITDFTFTLCRPYRLHVAVMKTDKANFVIVCDPEPCYFRNHVIVP